ncbi:MAG: transglutaminase family protein [Pseudomonadota bacterium]|nr:transglutaminase family protein [Pseudomonadota bacterium]
MTITINEFIPYLAESKIIDFSHPSIQQQAKLLTEQSADELNLVKNSFEFVRDQIRHTGDYQDNMTTLKASEVLQHNTGWCYAKSHLLAALLRANQIPTALCYQRLSCSEYKSDIFCLHGLNAVYLQEFGWIRIDPRGNKSGVNAQFIPPKEQLAFELAEHEQDIAGRFSEPLDSVVYALTTYQTYDEMINHFPDYNP